MWRARPMPRSISAPTIAVCWWRARPATAFAWSMRFRASSGWARASPPPAGSAKPRSCAPSRRCAICRAKMRNRGVTRARLIATEACRSASNGARFPAPRARRGRHRARDRRPRDRGAARRDRLHAAGRSAGRGRHPVRYRRRLLGAGPARPLAADAARPAASGDSRLDLDPDRRRHARRTPRRRRRSRARSSRR